MIITVYVYYLNQSRVLFAGLLLYRTSRRFLSAGDRQYSIAPFHKGIIRLRRPVRLASLTYTRRETRHSLLTRLNAERNNDTTGV